MIRVQPTTADGNRFLIGSDLKDAAEARREVEEWMNENNCILPRNERQLTVFENGIVVREWILVERLPGTLTQPPSPTNRPNHLFWQNWRRKTLLGPNPSQENVVALFATAV